MSNGAEDAAFPVLAYAFNGTEAAAYERDQAGSPHGRIVEASWGRRRGGRTGYVAGNDPDFPGPRAGDPTMGGYLYRNGRAGSDDQGHILPYQGDRSRKA